MGKQMFFLSDYVEVVQVCAKLIQASALYYEGTQSRISQEEVWQIKLACAAVQSKAVGMITKAARSTDLRAAFSFSTEESLAITKYIFPIVKHNAVAMYCREKSHYLSSEKHRALTCRETFSFESLGINQSYEMAYVAAEVEE